MDLVFFLLPASLLLGSIAVVGFLWSVRSGQMDDLETPAHRVLFDDGTELANQTTEEHEGKE